MLLVPALLVLPAAVVIAGFFGFRDTSGYGGGVLGIVLLVFCFVLLGSMTLNGWLLLRHPHTFTHHALPARASVTLVVLWTLLAAWTIVLVIGDRYYLSVGFGAVAAIVSIVSFIQAAGRRVEPIERVPLESVELGLRARLVAWAYLVVAGLSLLATLYFSIVSGGLSVAGGALGGPQTFALLLLGLPWSHPVYFVSVVLGFTLSYLFGIASSVVTVLAVVTNIVLVSLLLFDPARRTKLVNWFFRLRPRVRPV